MKTPTGYVALRIGRHVQNCIFLNWYDAEKHITDYDNAEYSIIDTLQDAEKYIISSSSNAGCPSSLEEEFSATAAAAAAPDQSPAPPSTPPPLPPATIDIDIDDVADDLDDDDEKQQQQQQQIAVSTKTTSFRPVERNSNNKNIVSTAEKEDSIYQTTTANNPASSVATSTLPKKIAPAAVVVRHDSTSKTGASNATLTSLLLLNNDDVNTIITVGKKWKISYDKLATYRKVDGTYPKPLPDNDIQKWLYYQKAEYKKKIRGLPNSFQDEKEQLLRNIGIVFTTVKKTKSNDDDNNNKTNNDNNSSKDNVLTTAKTSSPQQSLTPPTNTDTDIEATTIAAAADAADTSTANDNNQIRQAHSTESTEDMSSPNNENIKNRVIIVAATSTSEKTQCRSVGVVEPEIHHQKQATTTSHHQIDRNDNNENKINNVEQNTASNLQTPTNNPSATAAESPDSASKGKKTKSTTTTLVHNNNNNNNSAKLGKKWKMLFDKLITYRRLDGTYPKPIPDYDVRNWLYQQKYEYKKKIRGLHNLFSDDKEELLRNVGIDFSIKSKTTNSSNNNNSNSRKDTSSATALPTPTNTDDSIDDTSTAGPLKVNINNNQICQRQNKSRDPSYTTEIQNNVAEATNEAPGLSLLVQLETNQNENNNPSTDTTDSTFVPSYKKWKVMFEKFASYQNPGGTLPKRKFDKSLWIWIDSQRYHYRRKVQGLKHSLPDEKEELLRSIGFDFTPPNRKKQSKQKKENRPKKKRNKEDGPVILKCWKDNVTKLKQYMDEHDGSWDVKKEDDPKLRAWIMYQKSQYLRMKEGLHSKVNEEKVALLREIGVDFDKIVYSWSERIEQLKEYQNGNGNLNIPPEHPILGNWVRRMIVQYKQMRAGEPATLLDYKKINELRKAGVDFITEMTDQMQQQSIMEKKWNDEFEVMIDQLKVFKEQHGHCNVPRSDEQYSDLSKWCIKLQFQFRKLSNKEKANKCRLSPQQMRRLTEIGFQFVCRESYKTFEERIGQLKEYQRNGGDINKITKTHPDFGEFVSRQRRDYRCWCQGEYTRINEKRIKILESMGFDWNVDKWVDPADIGEKKTWDERFQQLLEYKAEHGHVIVPQKKQTEDNNGIGYWVKDQRVQYKLMMQGKKSLMTTEKALKLANIGFVFDASKYRFKRKRNGDAIISQQEWQE